ncbi:Wzz/FepE/Etk N-terminal domain-containing protein [Methylotenera sp.]|uniref:GumC family protein n=1 Tax=Methylotenera sp. TaxID=2051956 RepID=UPI00271960FC|nr:Wzz/FepE/Etk N-terminal domain-containing protein [Methylotenera sp.]MDO9204633.1 Wzz/FepE/Etk N-terminal domain-containing protein [Methylotenera sp.]MDP1524043.1 Wzz/FepE/Etk N-terminal domain-containing protein [Methylotenera sp.]MDP2071238.1 Wzz/FepE/Etk N-terminal domain-containing protein [Methylotenera sp.]MDP2231475.1 Wzz/FepE/Etk N-terminal domain-containing protein [Methylotenera sp.]MDP3005155.1 Wzz/FepE/Etk N-terminal domain-containing protein [Methylotenera sp.]
MAIEREMSLNDYVNIIKRRLPYVIGFFLLVFLAAIAVALKLPPVYQSTGTILIESQQVQSDLAKEKYATDRFEALKQIVLSKENLFNIAQKYQLYGLEKNPKISPTIIVQSTRPNIMVDLLRADAGQWGEKATFAFQVAFKHYDSDETYNVTNDLVQLFLDENDRASKERVTETADFYSKEAEKQKIILENVEKEISRYKQTHSHSLPENKEMQIGSLERLENDLRATQREYSTTQAELRSLDVSLESAKAGIGLTGLQDQASGATELDKLKSELAKQSSLYSENHPSIRALQRRIDTLEKNGSPEPVKTVTTQSVMVAKVQAQIDTANARLKSLEADERNIRAKINQIEGRVMQSSQTEGALSTLLRDYDNAKVAYAEIKAKLDNSKIAKNIEMENKGERFVLIEAPLLPEKPIKPNRILIILAGFFGAIVAAIGLAVLMEAFDKRIRGVDQLAAIMKIQPIATIPYITTEAELKQKKTAVSNTLRSAFVLILLILLFVHFLVSPLDVTVSKILAKF